jgi:sugar/nucleoside kinase (ribokinase family)
VCGRHATRTSVGRERIDALQAAGVQTECIRVVESSSGMALIVVSATGENSILILPGGMERCRQWMWNGTVLGSVDERYLAKLAEEVLADGPQNLLLKLGSRGA